MAATTAPAEFQPLPTTREERGREIARRGGIRKVGARYVVPSASNSNVPSYIVDIVKQTCTCPDHVERGPLGIRCKHIEAAYFWVAWESEGSVNTETGEVALPEQPKKKRKTYKQDWRAYDAAQTTERDEVPQLLYWLCRAYVDEPDREPGTPGQKPVPRWETAYAVATKVYSLVSGRRATTDIKAAFERGHLSRVWDHRTLFRKMADPTLTEVLVKLVEEAAGPLAALEAVCGQYAADSTGMGTVTYKRWFDVKHKQERGKHLFRKLHFLCGTATHRIVGVKVSSEADCPVLPELITQADRLHDMREISADKAYLAKYNLAAIVDVGATPLIPFKSNSVGMSSKSPHWRTMWAHFTLKAEDFYAKYHHRSNAETVVSMLKRNFSGVLRCKAADAQVNEILCMCILHNLQRIVHMVKEFGIDSSFGTKS